MAQRQRSSVEVDMVDLTSSTSSSPAPVPMISQRIVTVDYYTSPPNYLFDHVKNEFSGSKYNMCPIIRVFGATTSGQKACCHIHGVFPYIYVKADTCDTSDEDGLFTFTVALDEAICRALPRPQQQYQKEKQICQHIVKINKVKGRSFYGYHEDEELYYKIYFYSPFAVTKAAEILIGAGINGKKYQPYESHIPFIQQFLIDYNLFGMNLIHYGKLLFRRDENQKQFVTRKSSSSDPYHPRSHWDYKQMSVDLFQPEIVKRMSRCTLEFDVLADDILNRQEKRPRNANPGITSIWQDELERRRQNNVPNWSEITLPSSQDRLYTGELFEAGSLHLSALKEKLTHYRFDNSVRVKGEDLLSLADLLPSSQPHSFRPQNEDEIDLDDISIIESQSQFVDDDYVLNLFQEMENEADPSSSNYNTKLNVADDSILGSQEYRDIFERADESDFVTTDVSNENPILREFEDELDWSESFVSPTFDEIKVADHPTNVDIMQKSDNNNMSNVPDIEMCSSSGSSTSSTADAKDLGTNRTQPKNPSIETGNETKRLKNDEILEEHNCKIIFQPENNDNTLDEAAVAAALAPNQSDIVDEMSMSVSSLDVDVTTCANAVNEKTQAQLLFPKMLQRFPKEFISMSRPLQSEVPSNNSTSGSVQSEEVPISTSPTSSISNNNHAKVVVCKPISSSISNGASMKKTTGVSGAPQTPLSRLDRIKQAVLSKQQASGSGGAGKVISNKVNFGVQFDSIIMKKDFSAQSRPEQNDFGHQERPVMRDCEVQTDPPPPPQSEKTKKPLLKMTFWCTSGTQTDKIITTSSTKTCGCKCTCNSSIVAIASPSAVPPPQTPRKFRPGLVGLDSSPLARHQSGHRHGGSNDNSPSHATTSKLKTKDITPTRQNGLPPTSSGSGSGLVEQQSVQLRRTLDYTNLNSRRHNLKDSRLLELLGPHSGGSPSENQIAININSNSSSNVNSGSSPMVGQLLREKFRGSTSKRDKELEVALGTSGTLEFMKIHYDKTPDLSIESIYEYHSPYETDDSILKRIAAAHEGMTLFAWQKKRAEDRTRAKNEMRRQLENQIEIEIVNECPIFARQFEPMKQAPEEAEVSEMIEVKSKPNNNNATTMVVKKKNGPLMEPSMVSGGGAVYYHVNLSDDEDDGIIDVPPAVCHFRGGNLSDDDDSNDETNTGNNSQQQSSQTVVTPTSNVSSQRDYVLESKNLARGYKTPQVVTQTSSDYTPKSILKSGRRKRLSNPLLNKRKITWGTESTPPSDSSSKRSRISNEEDGQISDATSSSSVDKPLPQQPQPQVNVTEKSSSDNSSGKNNISASQWTFYNPDMSELDAPSPLNPYNAKINVSNLQNVKAVHQHQYMTTLCMEVFCSKRKGLRSNPQFDQINAIFYSVFVDEPENQGNKLGMFAIDAALCSDREPTVFSTKFDVIPAYFKDELSMIQAFIELVQHDDPDILVGYEIHYFSWGYFIERATNLGISVSDTLSRTLPRPFSNKKTTKEEEMVEWNETIRGRIVLNLWRLLRHEMTVQSYTFESAMFHIMHQKVPRIAPGALIRYWRKNIDRFKTVDYMCTQVCGVMDIIGKLDLINRTSELARLFGIQFFEVFSRGSQFRVESMMLRLTKSDNFLAPSPTVAQRAKMRAPEELPLIMEPYSKYYKDPVAVLDFQSLYPSIIIAYNYDFSTCLGRVEHLAKEGGFPFGCLDLEISPYELNKLMNDVHVSPCGVAFVKPSIRRGILPEMLQQILDTRLMVKRAMKANGNDNPTLQKVLDSRQLGLKLIANVTYGYTSANFSGRMPCVEIADSVVSKGRETLVRAIKLVEMNESRWGAKVIYGDTDSMFLLFPGCSREIAFDLAQDIADEVTRVNPKPVKLKLEKVYQPCILQTKKRYVGFSYESPQQTVPKYDAKGIETVRRDGCPAVAKILERSLRILFKYDDIPRLKEYIQVQFQKIFLGKVSLRDYTFAREYRGRSGYKPGAVVPSLRIAQRLLAKDPRAEPQPSERVPYVIIYGGPGQTLISQVRTPMEFAANPSLRINAVYYIERAVLPALERCFKLAAINVKQWYTELPRKYLRVLHHESRPSRKDTLDWFVISKNCLSCDGKSDNIVCFNCLNDYGCLLRLEKLADNMASKINATLQTCDACQAGVCVSLDCETWQRTIRLRREHDATMVSLRTALNFFQAQRARNVELSRRR